MAHALTTSHHAPLLTRGLHNVKERFSRYRLYRKTLNELSQLSIRELDDLGLSRASIRQVAYMAAYDQRP